MVEHGILYLQHHFRSCRDGIGEAKTSGGMRVTVGMVVRPARIKAHSRTNSILDMQVDPYLESKKTSLKESLAFCGLET